MTVKLMIADDHSLVREGLKQILELDGDIKVIAEAKDGQDCLDKLDVELPDILLLDINMPNVNGLEVLKVMKENKVNVKTIILTVHNEVEYLLKAVDIGIDGYMLKDSDSTELRKAIFSVLEGNTFIEPSLVPYLNEKMVQRDIDQQKLDELTSRELEILKLLSKGNINRDIGNILSISERTVKNHISSVFRKIQVTDRTQAAIFAIRNNLVEI